MPPRTAIFYAENPMAILRDFPDDCDQAKALAAMDRALSVAATNDPLAYEAWRRRQARRANRIVGAGEAAARVLAWRRSRTAITELPDAPDAAIGR
jgi:hypothetical protein